MSRTAIERKRCKMAGAVSRLAEEPRTIRDMGMLNLEEAAAHLSLTVEDFEFHSLLGRISAPVDGLWSSASLVLKLRGSSKETNYRSGLYVIQFMDFVKIGFSDKLLQRIAAIQDALPLRIKVHRIIDGPTRKGEKALHRRFAEYRTRGEWFRFEGSLASWIEGGCK
jgi:hypothetical protein